MKKIFLSLALVATMVGLNACGGDEPYEPTITNETVVVNNLINCTVTLSNNSVNYIESANYTFKIEYTDMREATIEVIANGVKFDSHMPYPVSFAMESIKTNKLNDDYLEFHSSNVKFLNPSSGEENTNYTLTNVSGYIDKRNKVYSLQYTVNNTWRVQVCNTTISSRVEGNDYTAPTELYYIYDIDISEMKAEVFILNVQFSVGGASSPLLKKISIPDLDVVATATGFELSGDNIVPFNYSGTNLDQATPAPPMIVTNYHGSINILEGTHSIFFNSMGGEHDNTSSLYLWTWKPAA